jgi:hypothetical protein
MQRFYSDFLGAQPSPEAGIDALVTAVPDTNWQFV